MIRTALLATLVTRTALVPIGLVAIAILGHALDTDLPPPGDLAYLPLRWDALNYLDIARAGYPSADPGDGNSLLVFFPAFPLFLRGFASLLRLPNEQVVWLWTGVALSTVFFCAALAYVHALTNLMTQERSGSLAVWLIACYPFSLFHGQVYTESLFLLAAVAACYHCHQRQFAAAFAFGCLVGLTRPTGVLVVVMLAAMGWQFIRRHELENTPEKAWLAAAVLSPAVGTLAYSAWLKVHTGHWLFWVTGHAGWGREITNPIDVVWTLARSVADRGVGSYLLDRPYELARPYELVYLAVALCAVGLVWPVVRKFGWGMGVFVLLSIAVPFFGGGLTSIGRFTCVLFPLFMWLSTRSWARPLTIAFAALQVIFAALFYTHRHIF